MRNVFSRWSGLKSFCLLAMILLCFVFLPVHPSQGRAGGGQSYSGSSDSSGGGDFTSYSDSNRSSDSSGDSDRTERSESTRSSSRSSHPTTTSSRSFPTGRPGSPGQSDSAPNFPFEKTFDYLGVRVAMNLADYIPSMVLAFFSFFLLGKLGSRVEGVKKVPSDK